MRDTYEDVVKGHQDIVESAYPDTEIEESIRSAQEEIAWSKHDVAQSDATTEEE